MYLLGEAETFLYSPHLSFKSGFNGAGGDDPLAPLAAGDVTFESFIQYVDGVLAATDTMSYHVDFKSLPGFAVGQYAGFGKAYPDLNIVDDHFNGLMDEIAIYKRVLTAAEILAVGGPPPTHPNTAPADLVMYWNFDD